jgi:hypothetical protein
MLTADQPENKMNQNCGKRIPTFYIIGLVVSLSRVFNHLKSINNIPNNPPAMVGGTSPA